MVQFDESQPFDYEDYFSSAAQFLYKYKWIFCYNNTKFIRCGVLEELPQEWINDLNTVTNEEFNRIPVGFIKDTWCDSFRDFLLQVKKLQVQYDVHENIEQQADNRRPKQTGKGINAKKAYEIANLGSFIELKRLSDDSTMYIDFGSGLGYLSELIHERSGMQVLGIEGNASLVQTCNDRSAACTTKAVQYCHHYVTDDSFDFIEQQCKDRFDNLPHHAALVGLHACADLSITAINCFLRCKWTKSLTIMPCCYHRMKPLDEKAPVEFYNFPLSEELRNILHDGKRKIICRSFLRLGCQQTAARWKERSVEQHLQHGRVMFRRGLIDAILEGNESVRIGKLRQIPDVITVDNMLEQFTLVNELDPNAPKCRWTNHHRDKMATLLETYGTEGPKLAEYVECLQTCLQSVCENVILLDRMCYMESVANRSGLKIRRNLVRLRDDGLSPRCFILYATKD